MEADIFSFVANNGIAVVVLIWFMFRMEKVVNNNTKAIQEVKVAIATCPVKK